MVHSAFKEWMITAQALAQVKLSQSFSSAGLLTIRAEMRSFVQVLSRRTLQRRREKLDKGGKEVKDALSSQNLASSQFLGKFEHKWDPRVFLS